MKCAPKTASGIHRHLIGILHANQSTPLKVVGNIWRGNPGSVWGQRPKAEEEDKGNA